MKLVTIARLGDWWAVRVLCACGCGETVHTGLAATVRDAVRQVRGDQRLKALAAEAFT